MSFLNLKNCEAINSGVTNQYQSKDSKVNQDSNLKIQNRYKIIVRKIVKFREIRAS